MQSALRVKRLQARTEPLEDNPAVSRILNFLAADIYACPERLQAVDSRLITRINSLVGHVDLNVPLLRMMNETGNTAQFAISD